MKLVNGPTNGFSHSIYLNSIYLNVYPFEVVFRYQDKQLQVAENYTYLFNLRPNIYKYWCLNSHFISNNRDLVD